MRNLVGFKTGCKNHAPARLLPPRLRGHSRARVPAFWPDYGVSHVAWFGRIFSRWKKPDLERSDSRRTAFILPAGCAPSFRLLNWGRKARSSRAWFREMRPIHTSFWPSARVAHGTDVDTKEQNRNRLPLCTVPLSVDAPTRASAWAARNGPKVTLPCAQRLARQQWPLFLLAAAPPPEYTARRCSLDTET